MDPNAGIAVIYFPFLPNPEVEGVNPKHIELHEHMEFHLHAEDIDKVVALARATFEQGRNRSKGR